MGTAYQNYHETSTKLALQNNYANRFYELHKHCIAEKSNNYLNNYILNGIKKQLFCSTTNLGTYYILNARSFILTALELLPNIECKNL